MTLPSGSPARSGTYSSWFRWTLSFGALVTAVLPAPVMIFRLLPAYGVQAKFLIFYGPLICFLTLAYLFYIRDTLARAMFADLLNPAPEPDPYYGEPLSASLRRTVRRARSLLLALLPVLLLLTSSYCVLEYVRLFNRSVAAVVEQKARDAVQAGMGGRLGRPRSDSTAPRTRGRRTRKSVTRAPQVDTVASASNADSLRQHVLQTLKVEEIPGFIRLNILYIGIFLSAEIAFILMGLKEYAKEAMGLSERDLLLGTSASGPP